MERLTERLTDKSYCISDIRAIQKETFYEDMECRRGFDLYTGKAIDKLAEYEDLEEQNKLLKLPCAVGDIIWDIDFISQFVEHDLKILPEYFEAVASGKKKFELRKNDRDYKVHDMFVLREWEPDKGYTGRDYINEIDYILKDCPEYGLMDGYIIFGW